MKIESEVKIISHNIKFSTAEDTLEDAKIKLTGLGEAGQRAIEILRRLAAVVEVSEGTVALFEISLPVGQHQVPKCKTKFSSVSEKEVRFNVSPDAQINDVMCLSARVRNCCESEGISTVADLISKSRKQLLVGRNLGETSLDEIERELQSIGHRLCS